MKKDFIQLAIIGPTASGKSDLAIKVAMKIDAYILSLDSLSIYKNINIVSAKPSQEELSQVKHFGIDEIDVDEYFSADIFINLYEKVKDICKKDSKNLIIVGGTSFYLKSLLQGLSPLPKITNEVKQDVEKSLENLQNSYQELVNIDADYMQNISISDKYRIEKALLIHKASGLTPSEYFKENPPKPIVENISIFNIDVDRDTLRSRIKKRTQKMFDIGLVDEVCLLDLKYTREPKAMSSIGILEVLEYLDGKVDKKQMLENISIHTAQLAKRQQTFNKHQFENLISAPLEELEEIILSHCKN